MSRRQESEPGAMNFTVPVPPFPRFAAARALLRSEAMRSLLPVVILVACSGGTPKEPIERYPLLDDPLFDVWHEEPQVGTVLLSDQHATEGTDGFLVARFEPAGDRGFYSVIDEEGDCRLYDAFAYSLCDPACSDSM